MNNIEALVHSSQWDDVEKLLDECWSSSEPTALELFFRSLASFGKDDYFKAYNYALQAFEMSGNIAELTEYLGTLCVAIGRVKESYFYRKMLFTMEKDEKISSIIPDGLLLDYTQSLSQIEDNPLLRRGIKFEMQFEWEKAEHWFRQHMAFEPNDKNGYLFMVGCLISQERYRGASEILKGARSLFPKDETFSSLMGDVLTQLGQFDEAGACYQWAIEHAPFDEKVHARLIRGLLKNPRHSFAFCFNEMQAWNKSHLQEIQGAMPPAELGERNILRVGFLMSGVDRSRSGPEIGNVLSWHDEKKFQFIGYGDGDITSPINRHFKTAFCEWRNVSSTDAMTLRNMVVADGIDILIDMGGVASSESMRCFGSRLAPIQILWANSNVTGGAPEIDYVVSDRCQDELKSKHLASDVSTVFSACREGFDDVEERVDDRLIFVADATLSELSCETVSLWAKVLLENPESMLLLRSHDFFAEDNSRTLIELFGIFGIAHRVDVIQEADRRHFFAQGDVALLPSEGSTAEVVLDALIAGVPILACRKKDTQFRSSTDVLLVLKFTENMIFDSSEDFVAGATSWMQNREMRQNIKQELKEDLMKSDFFDAEYRMSHFERMLQEIWQKKSSNKV